MGLSGLFNFTQPNTDAYAISGYDFLRIKAYLSNSQGMGDLYFSQQGCHMITVGPDSDIAQVQVGYFDDQSAPTLLSQIMLTPDRPFPGNLLARNTTPYMPAAQAGRILIWPQDLYDPNYLPAGFNPITDKIVLEVPILDVIQYFKPQDVMPAVRADKVFYYQTLPFGSRDTYVLIPFYGRRYAHIQAKNNTAVDQSITIDGLNYTIADITTPGPTLQSITTVTVIATTATFSKVVTQAANGRFDMLQVKFTAGAATANLSLKVTVSDIAP